MHSAHHHHESSVEVNPPSLSGPFLLALVHLLVGCLWRLIKYTSKRAQCPSTGTHILPVGEPTLEPFQLLAGAVKPQIFSASSRKQTSSLQNRSSASHPRGRCSSSPFSVFNSLFSVKTACSFSTSSWQPSPYLSPTSTRYQSAQHVALA